MVVVVVIQKYPYRFGGDRNGGKVPLEKFIEFGPPRIYSRLEAKSTFRSKIVHGGGGGPEVSL